jgi:hypothetical protein
MTTQEIANRLVELNRNPDLHMEIYEELFDPNVVSVEHTGGGKEDVGFEAIKAKGDEWFSMMEEMHSLTVSEPLVSDNSFAVTFSMDVTFNEKMVGMEGRQKFTELAVYHVKDGKIVREEFYG